MLRITTKSSRSLWVRAFSLIVVQEAKFSFLSIADFSTMEMKLDNNLYPSFNDFVDDAMLVFSNCKRYNPEGSIYARNASKMERFVKDWVATERAKNDSIGY